MYILGGSPRGEEPYRIELWRNPADDGKRFQRWTFQLGAKAIIKGEGFGEGELEIGPGRRLADDGKRF